MLRGCIVGIVESWREARARKAAAAAERSFQAATASWTADDQRLRELITAAQELGTDDAPPLPPGCPVVLKRGERAYYWLDSVSLVETRRGVGTYQGGYSGFSFHVMRNVNWRVGGTRGHFEPGPESPTVIDAGSVTITNQRVVFQGSKQAREWAFSKLLGVHDDPATPWTAIAVSNRQKVSGVLYTPAEAEEFRFRLHLALADQGGNRAAFVAALDAERAQHDAARPVAIKPGEGPAGTSAFTAVAGGPRWARIGVPVVAVLVLLGAISAATGGNTKKTAAPTTLATSAPTTVTPHASVTTTPPSTIAQVVATAPPTTHAPVTAAPTPRTSTPTQAPAPPPVTSPPGVHPGAFCSPPGAIGYTSAGTRMICSGTNASGVPYANGAHRWRSA